ncbi:MAG: TIGR00282 family metallophosphoesterase [Treponemataceae bacterium]
MSKINVLFVGDVCADIAVLTIQKILPEIIKRENIFFTVLNAENALNGEGLDEALAKVFFRAGVDVITGGNHSLQDFSLRKNFLHVENVLRPANIPEVGGEGFVKLKKGEHNFLVANFLGRENMRIADSPFASADKIFPSDFPSDKVFSIVDFHADSTEEKEALGFYLDGRVSLVVGTHTHVQTADEKILPKGTGYITDVGFVGAANSIIGSNPEFILEKQQNFFSTKPRWKNSGEAIFSAIVASLDIASKKTKHIKRIYQKVKL